MNNKKPYVIACAVLALDVKNIAKKLGMNIGIKFLVVFMVLVKILFNLSLLLIVWIENHISTSVLSDFIIKPGFYN